MIKWLKGSIATTLALWGRPLNVFVIVIVILSFSFCWSGHVFSSLWSNVSKVTSVYDLSVCYCYRGFMGRKTTHWMRWCFLPISTLSALNRTFLTFIKGERGVEAVVGFEWQRLADKSKNLRRGHSWSTSSSSSSSSSPSSSSSSLWSWALLQAAVQLVSQLLNNIIIWCTLCQWFCLVPLIAITHGIEYFRKYWNWQKNDPKPFLIGDWLMLSLTSMSWHHDMSCHAILQTLPKRRGCRYPSTQTTPPGASWVLSSLPSA